MIWEGTDFRVGPQQNIQMAILERENLLNDVYILLHYTFALKIYKSQLELGENRAISGLHYKKTNNGNLVLSNSLTCCIRINFKRLSRSHTARILTIANSKSTDEYPNFLRDHP